MLKVLIVDDEILVRVGIKMLVDWSSEGFEIVGEASNSLQALEMWEKLKPDIIITDMKMPQMDGVELIRKLKQLNAKTKVLILSCYDDYSYMKEALNFGAVDYILKPEMTKENITEALRRIKRQITDELLKEKEYYQLKTQAELSSYLTKEKFFMEIISGKRTDPNEIKNALKDYGIEADENLFAVMVISAGNKLLQNQEDIGISNALGISLFNIIQGVLNSVSHAILIHNDRPYCYTAVLYGRKGKLSLDEIKKVAASIIQAVKTYTPISVTIGISEIQKGICSIRQLYEHAMEIAKYKALFGTGSVITYDMLNSDVFDKQECKNIMKMLNDILYINISNENWKMIEETLEKVVSMVRRSRSIYLLNAVIMEFIGWFNRQITEISVNANSNLEKNTDGYIMPEDLFVFDDLEEIKDFFMEKMMWIWELKTSDNQGNRVVKKAIDYIKANYGKEITLADLAEYVNVSKNYLSFIFKTETGQNFIDFLTNLRVNIARMKLENEDLKVYEVASIVGFENERYFSQIFRKKTGMTPSEYKKMYCKA